MDRFSKRFVRLMHWATVVIEVFVAFALVALAGGVLLALAKEMLLLAMSQTKLTSVEFNLIIGTILEIFILLELFRIAVAYMRRKHVVPVVLEAALVAVARKFVVFEGGGEYLAKALGLSALLLAVAISWWMLAHSGALEDIEDEE
jgi:uncharacterized membrane protein (DUF373 family)